MREHVGHATEPSIFSSCAPQTGATCASEHILHGAVACAEYPNISARENDARTRHPTGGLSIEEAHHNRTGQYNLTLRSGKVYDSSCR